jgi:hypothetical protein
MGVKLAAASGGSVELVPTNTASNYTATFPASTGTVLTTTSPKTGNVLQVLQTVKTSYFTFSGGSWLDVTGLSVSITPSSASSKILVSFSASASQSATSGIYGVNLRIVRDATTIYVGDAAGSSQQASAQSGSNNGNYAYPMNGQYLDSPATTSAITYKIQTYGESGGATLGIGGSYLTTAAYSGRVPSQIIVMEIAG